MKIRQKEPPRKFEVGREVKRYLFDSGEVELNPDELVTLVSVSGRRCDVVAKEWGFYATPSINGRLKNEGFKTALVRNPEGRYFILLVEEDKMSQFQRYIREERSEIVEFLDER